MVLLNSSATNIATFHAFRQSSAWYTALKPYMNLLLSRLDARIAVSRPALEFVGQYFDGPYEVIPNGIDVARFLDPEPLPWANDGRPRILFVGRFTEPRKGFKYLLRAMPLVHQQFPDARLVVVGTGRPEKYAWADGALRGGQRRLRRPRALRRTAALLCELRCLLRAVGGARKLRDRLVGSDGGWQAGGGGRQSRLRQRPQPWPGGALAPPKDEQALALALVRLLSDAGLRRQFGSAGRAMAGGYDWPLLARRVLDLYDRAARSAAEAPQGRGLA
jgi:phosphatidylinositol alpha-mannosyltransferase